MRPSMNKNTQFIFVSFTICLGAFIGLSPAIINGFPLVNPDTGAYVSSGFKTPPIDRSVFYSIFLKATSLKLLLQVPAFVQSILGSTLIFSLFSAHFEHKKAAALSIFAILTLSLFTPYAWYVSQLNPDIFMGYFTLAVIGYLFYNNKEDRAFFYISVILLSASFHSSILLLCIVLCITGVVYAWLRKKHGLIRKHIIIIAGVSTVFLLASGITFRKHGIFSPNPSGHIFLMSRLAETGILKKVLDEECKTSKYGICETYSHFNGRQWDFMWQGRFPHSGNKWLNDTVSTEYNDIIKKTLSNRKYLSEFLTINIKDAAGTIYATNVDDGIHRFEAGSSPWENIKSTIPGSFPAFAAARQQTSGWHFELINKVIRWGMLSLTISSILLYLLADRKNKYSNTGIIIFSLAMIAANILLTTMLSTYLGRFSSRLIWVLPLAVLLAFFRARNWWAVSRCSSDDRR